MSRKRKRPSPSETDARAADHLQPEMDPDDKSVPPVGDLDTDFFGGRARLDPAFDLEMRDPRVAMKMTASAALRRAHLARYVKGAVGAAVAVCLAAAVKAAVLRGQTDHGTAGTAALPQLAPPPGEVALAPMPAPAATLVDPPLSAEPIAQVAIVPAAADIPTPERETTASDPAAASDAKSVARSALEGGRVDDAIEAGERSVELDPTDGETWLILGAAYQQKGAWKDARRCYKGCVDQGKRGPRGECAAMLR